MAIARRILDRRPAGPPLDRTLLVEPLEPRILLSAALDLLGTTTLRPVHALLAPAPTLSAVVSPTIRIKAAFLDGALSATTHSAAAAATQSAAAAATRSAAAAATTAPRLVPLAATAHESWIGGAAGAWDDAANWSADAVPDAGTAVTITGPVKVTLGDDSADSVALSNGVTLSGGTLSIADASTADGATLQGITLDLGATLALTGIDTLSASTVATLSTGGTLTNADTLTVTGAAAQTLSAGLDNDGLIAVTSATLALTGNEMRSGAGARVTVAAGATLDLTAGGSETYAGTLVATGAGTVALAGGELAADPTAGFTLDAAGALLQWSGGAMQATGTTLRNIGGITLAGTGTESLGGTLVNTGTILDQSNLDLEYRTYAYTYGGVIDNTGSFSIVGDGGIGGDGPVTNSGQFAKVSGTGTSTVDVSFDNQGGRIAVDSGTLQLTGGTQAGGTITAAAGATLLLTGPYDNTFVLSGTLTGTGAGTVTFDNAGIGIDPAGATVDFAPGELHWLDGNLIAPGTLTNTGGITFANLTPGSSSVQLAGSVDNHGTITDDGAITATGYDGALTLTNEAGATLALQDDGSIAGAVTIDNAGLLRMPAGTLSSIAITALDLLAAGSVEVDTGTLDLAGSGGTVDTQDFRLSTGATLALPTGDYAGTLSSTGGGLVNFTGGTVAAGGATFDFASGVLSWTSGTVDALLANLTNAGALALTGSVAFGGGSTGGSLVNSGTIVDTGQLDLIYATYAAYYAGNLANTGSFSIVGDGGIGGRGPVTNSGQFAKVSGTGTSTIGVEFDNAGGRLAVDSGALALTGGITSTGGTIDVLTGTLTLPGGAFADTTLQTTTDSATGARSEILIDGRTTFGGVVTGIGTGLVVLAGGQTFQAAANGGTLAFAAGELQFQGGVLDGGTAGLVNAGELTVNQQTTQSQSTGLLINRGTLLIAGASVLEFAGGSLDNEATGVIDFLDDGAIFGGGGGPSGPVTNAGIIRASGGATAEFFAGDLDATGGRFDLQSGTLAFSATDLVGTLTGSGPGVLDIVGGFNNLVGLTVSTNTTLDFAPGALEWSSGSIVSTGTITNLGALTLSGPDHKILGGTLVNLGTITELGGYLGLDGASGTMLDNAGLFDLDDGGVVTNNYVLGAQFINTGTLIANGAGDTETIVPNVFASTGTVVAASGTFAVLFGDGFNFNPQLASGTLTGGSWQALGGATLDFGALVTDNAASLLLSGAGSTIGDLTALASNAGTLTLTDGATLSLAGTLSNTGLLQAGPGATLSIGGDLDLGAAGTLATVLDGRPSSDAYGTIAVAGTAALAGSFAATLASGFGATGGDDYAPLTFAAATGSFGSETLPAGLQAQLQPHALALTVAMTGVDLAVATVVLQTDAAAPGQPVRVQFTVVNRGGAAATGDWTDSVYLSVNGALSPGDVLLGRLTHAGGLAAGASYTATLTAALPPLTDGSYGIVVLSDSREQVPDADRADNAATSLTMLAVATPVLTLGQPVGGSLAAGQGLYYKVVAPAGGELSLKAQFADAGGTIYASAGGPPTASSFDQTASGAAASLTLSVAAGDTVYVLVEGAGAYTLTAAPAPLTITALTATSATNDQTSEVIGLTGAPFTPGTTVSLVAADGTTYAATSTDVLFSTAIAATFDLTAIPGGTYTVEARADGMVASAPSPFTVVPRAYSTDVSALSVTFNSPSDVISGDSGGGVVVKPLYVGVSFQNPTDTPILITDFDIIADNATFPKVPLISLGPDPLQPFMAQEIAALITSGSPLLVPANGHANLLVEAFPDPDQPNVNCSFGGEFQDVTGGPLDLAALSAAIKPANISQPAWDAVFQNFSAAIGTTAQSLASLEQADATLLQLVTGSATPPGNAAAIDLEILKADDALPTPTLDSATDISYPAPGLSLTFGRTFESSIVGRFTDGRLGHGWVDNWDYAASLDVTTGLVTIREGATTRGFASNADGSFTAATGDTGRLTEVDGAFVLTEQDGSVTRFNPDGTLDYVQDADGNRVTAGYTGGLLTTLTAADGDALTIAYNADGKIASVTDPTGRVARYGYDSTGQELTSVTTSAGMDTYGYGGAITGPGAYELASIGDPGGTNVAFSYDTEGRLTEELVDGAAATTFTYGADSYRVTDANGNATTAYYDQNGIVDANVNALGQVALERTNSAGQVVSLGEVGGGASTIAYAPGTTSDTTATGTTSFGLASTTGSLTSLTDQDGNLTGYSYDAAGNLTDITYADGTTARYSRAADGAVTQIVDRGGNKTTDSYDSQGLLLEQTASDGTTTSYTYDAHGDMLSATDAAGTITMAYDAAGRLTRVTYPDGRFLAYGYDAAGRRTQTVDQDGFTTNNSYDGQGRLAEVTDATGALIVRYTYDAVGNLVRQDNGNGTYTTESYDAAGEVLGIVNHAPGGAINSEFDYTYNVEGEIVSMTTLAGTATYGYDAAGRLATARLADGTTITYAYDAAGNRTAVVTNGVTTDYTADDLNEYATVGGKVQVYDADGQLTSGAGGTYTYDGLGRIASLTNAGGTWTYQYDALGDRSSETHDGVTTDFLIDPTGLGNVVAEYTATGALVADYTYGDGLTSQVTSAGANYYDFDATGSTAGLTGAAGTYVATYTYDPFGNVLSSTGSVANRFQFGGAYGAQSDGSGLIDLRLRSYDPATGRFTSPDPSGLAGGVNLYAYADNNPLSFVDPAGLAPGPFAPPVDPLGRTLLGDAQLKNAINAILGIADSGIPRNAESFEAAAKFNSESLTNLLNEAAGYDVYGTWVSETAAAKLADIAEQVAANGGELADVLEPGAVTIEENPAADVAALGSAATLLANIGPLALDLAAGLGAVGVGLTIGYYLGTYLYNLDVKYNITNNIFGSTTHILAGPSDPNLIAGPSGYGDGHFITGSSASTYYLAFTNEPNADAPARIVTITQQLDPGLDLSTFSLQAFGFGDTTITVPAGLQDYATRVDDRAAAGVFVDVAIHLDTTTRTLSVSYTSIDPGTLDDEANPLIGFLPPDKTEPMGTGWLSYVVSPVASLATGTAITAQASIVFDSNAPVVTNAYVNTIDDTPPTSTVTALPPLVASPAIALAWSGSDGPGSGIASYSIFVAEDGGAYTAFLQNTTATSATFTGATGHSYSFYSIATDHLGLQQQPPASAQAMTRVDTPPVADAITATASSGGPAVTLTALYTDLDVGDTHRFSVDTANTKGLVTNLGNGTFTYAPNGAFATLGAGQTATDSFSYTVTDGEGLSSTATATITVVGQDTAPVAANITGMVSSGGPAITLKASYTDPDAGDTHSFTDNTSGTKGVVTDNGDGTFSYNPNGAFASLTLGQKATDSFTYTVTDGEGLSSTATATITVVGQDTAPVAANITGMVSSGGPAITLKASYTDPDAGDTHSFTDNTTGTKGVVTDNGDGTFSYNPNGAFASLTPGQKASDSFTYTVTDGEGLSSTATATITVVGQSAVGPVANPDGPYEANSEAVLAVGDKTGVLANDTDAAGGSLTAALVQGPAHGLLILNPNGGFEYLADGGYVGADSFTHRAVDGAAASAPAMVSIDVQNTLTLRVAADKFEGGARFTVTVDGVQLGGIQTASRSFDAGKYQDITLTGDFPADPKQVTVTFINDLYRGTPTTDRNLYVESLTLDGQVFLGASASNPVGHPVGGATVLYSDGTITFDVAPPKLDTLTLRVAADKFMGGARFTVAVDGVQVGGVQVASRSFAEGKYQDVTLSGRFGTDPKKVSVSFINDMYNGTPATDRNLYVESLTFEGRTIPGATATNPVGVPLGSATVLYSDGTITFDVAPAAPAGLRRGVRQRHVGEVIAGGSPAEIRILPGFAATGLGARRDTIAWVASFVRGEATARPPAERADNVVVSLS